MSYLQQNLGFSLILATLGDRLQLLGRLLDSLASQIEQGVDVELIVVEQSDRPRLWEKALRSWRNRDRIIYKHVNWRGLSAARNFGLTLATKPFIGFPDDDCWYPPNLLVKIGKLLQNGLDIVGVRHGPRAACCIDAFQFKVIGVREARELFRLPAFGLFFRRHVFIELGGFDEQLGLGREIGAGEETDLLVRAYLRGMKIAVVSGCTIGHPTLDVTKLDYRRGRAYGLGFGVICRRYVRYLPLTIALIFMERCFTDISSAIVRGLLKLDRARTVYDLAKLSGRLHGFFLTHSGLDRPHDSGDRLLHD